MLTAGLARGAATVNWNRLWLVLFSGLLLLTVDAQAHCRDTSTLRTVEGRVLSLSSSKGESDLDLLTVDLAIEGGNAKTVQLMLAPDQIFDEIGFSVNVGDRLRARVFVDSAEPAPVHKVQNLSQGTIVRLRTLRATPLWNTSGRWQGGSIHNGPGPRRLGHRRGQGPPP